jgi:hypothetical protein
MSYLSQPATTTDYGIVEIGAHINVTDGVISLGQDLSPTADVTFNSVTAGDITSHGEEVITEVTPAAGNGISLTNVVTGGPHASFTVSNTGVLSLIAGTGISLSGATGNITISSSGTTTINTYGTTTSYTASATDEYIGVNSTSNVTITLPAGVTGKVYTVKDEHGNGSGKITIAPQTGEKIDGATSYTNSVPYLSVTVVFRAGQWYII